MSIKAGFKELSLYVVSVILAPPVCTGHSTWETLIFAIPSLVARMVCCPRCW